MDSNLGLLLLHGKIIKSTLRQIQPHMDTLSESVTIIDFIQRCILSTVSSFLYAFIDDSENRLLPNNVMMIRNYGGDKEGLKERCGGAKEQQRWPSQVGVPIQVELKSNLDSRNSPHQNHFGRSLYGWKDKRINFPRNLSHIQIHSESTEMSKQ
jgi:hypothetical protein